MTDLQSEVVVPGGSVPQAAFPPEPKHCVLARPLLDAGHLEQLLGELGQRWPRNRSKTLTDTAGAAAGPCGSAAWMWLRSGS